MSFRVLKSAVFGWWLEFSGWSDVVVWGIVLLSLSFNLFGSPEPATGIVVYEIIPHKSVEDLLSYFSDTKKFSNRCFPTSHSSGLFAGNRSRSNIEHMKWVYSKFSFFTFKMWQKLLFSSCSNFCNFFKSTKFFRNQWSGLVMLTRTKWPNLLLDKYLIQDKLSPL